MFMRFRGGGVGHKSTRDAVDVFLRDRDQEDLDRRARRLGSDAAQSEDNAKPEESAALSEDEELEVTIEELLKDLDEAQLIDEMMDYGYELDEDHESLEGSGDEESDNDDGWEENGSEGEDGMRGSLAELGYAEM
ncbi:hypothetical protein CPC08DRAFT_771329 [Agrocybe pediades]|nr:hypothetical protein CPC08DRAFT_771329 [Agrocybe pediades]